MSLDLPEYTCTSCGSTTFRPKSSFNIWIFLFSAIFFLVPAIIYLMFTAKRDRCPKCSQKTLIPRLSPTALKMNPPLASADHSETRDCPFCAEPVKAKAVLCKHCGKDLEPIMRIETDFSKDLDAFRDKYKKNS